MRVWTVSEIKAGTLTQCLGVGRRLDPEPRQIIVKRPMRQWEIGPLSPYWRLPEPEPDILLGCGGIAQTHMLAIARSCHRKPFLVFLAPPAPEFATLFDMTFISRHDWTEERERTPNLFPMLGVPHQITRELLAELRPAARARWMPEGGKAVAVLVGGENRAFFFDDATVDRLVGSLEALAAEGWTALVSTSRRSRPNVLERLLAAKNPRIKVWDRVGENPYRQFLAAADAVLATSDSITMTCEAATTGHPAYIFMLPKKDSPRLAKFERFHHDMSETQGMTRLFHGRLDAYDYSPPNEAERIAGLILDAYQARENLAVGAEL